MLDFVLAAIAHLILNLFLMPFMPFIAIGYTAYRSRLPDPGAID